MTTLDACALCGEEKPRLWMVSRRVPFASAVGDVSPASLVPMIACARCLSDRCVKVGTSYEVRS